MAARKSCTHMTWAEAKNKVGEGGKKTTKKIPKKVPHDQALLHKVIAKHGDDDDAVKILRKQRKAEARAMASAERRAAERKTTTTIVMSKPYDASLEKLHELAQALRKEGSSPTNTATTTDQSETAMCRSMQVDELMALEAMMGANILDDDDDDDDDVDITMPQLHILDASNINALREAVDAYQMDEGDELVQKNLIRLPPLAMCMELEIENIDLYSNNDVEVEQDGVLNDVVAHVLLKVTLPPNYPLGMGDDENPAVPLFELCHCFVTDRSIECPADTPLESLAYVVDEAKLISMMKAEALQLHPDLSVYAVAVEWLSEALATDDYLRPNPHAMTRYVAAVVQSKADEE